MAAYLAEHPRAAHVRRKRQRCPHALRGKGGDWRTEAAMERRRRRPACNSNLQCWCQAAAAAGARGAADGKRVLARPPPLPNFSNSLALDGLDSEAWLSRLLRRAPAAAERRRAALARAPNPYLGFLPACFFPPLFSPVCNTTPCLQLVGSVSPALAHHAAALPTLQTQ